MALTGRATPFLVKLLAALLACGCVAATAAPAQAPANGKSATPAATKTKPPRTPARKQTAPAPAEGRNAQETQKRQLREPSSVPPPVAPLKPLPPVDTTTPPPSLPRASRERMRACAEEWRKMKLVAKSALPMWRDFATGCLTRQ